MSGTNPFTVPSELYRLNTVTYESSSYAIELQRLNRNEYYNIAKSKLTRPTKSCPIYLYEDNKVLVYPKSILSFTGSIVRVDSPSWPAPAEVAKKE